MPFLLDDGGDVFTPGDPPHGVCWSPTADAMEVDPVWVRLDDPAGYRLASSYSISRGRSSEMDRTGTGTATISFNDLEGILDPTNQTSPFWDGVNDVTQLDPMTQAAIALMNPITGDWFTIYRGFVAGPNHELEMFTSTRGRDVITWDLVDAFDVFANVVLTPGVHGDPPDPPLATFPNIYYRGDPPNLATQVGVFRHVDTRIVQLLDDAGWPTVGEKFLGLRNIFSGNVKVQGTVLSRRDSLLEALFSAADAEFPGIANVFVSREGVVTFHGRYARFFPDNPGYGINHWYVGSLADAAADPDVVPIAMPLRFYRSKDDIINSCYVLPQNVNETSGGVVLAENPASQGKYGFRSLNFDNLIVGGGHDDSFVETTPVEEANLFADYFVSNYAAAATRVGTLRFTSRGPDAVGATALWDMMTRVELGDVITLTTEHAGGGGFTDTDPNSDWFVEHISYTVEPGNEQMLNVTLELEVSPQTFFANNPFGFNDNEFS